ncbi:uncharacterized protein [Euwallacea similis]|uniref:uncharacterized protein n=1 Tax=Euwallacea similis TaxID=1736056 RepID=UPI00344DE427
MLIGEFIKMYVLGVLSVIFPCLLAQEQLSVSINKPRTRLPKPWEETNTNTDHVRCFCNLPLCVTTGYMCKSTSGGCFSELLDVTSKSGYRARHGCIEHLSESQLPHCPISDKGLLPKKDKDHQKSSLLCCTNDMCNHVDNPLTKSFINRSLDDADNKVHRDDHEAFLYTDSEVWFRAATIAVPICGAVILFALVALAVKFLKSENRNSLQHNKLGSTMYVLTSAQKDSKWTPSPYRPCTTKRTPYYAQVHPSAFLHQRPEEGRTSRDSQAPLLLSSERDIRNSAPMNVCLNKNEANEKGLHYQSTQSLILELGKATPDYSAAANMNVNNNEDKFRNDSKPFIA